MTFDIYLSLSTAAIILISTLFIGWTSEIVRTMTIRSYCKTIGPKAAKLIDNYLTIIGVIHHELSHLLAAILTGAKVKGFRLFQVKDGTLGYVNIVPRGPFWLKAIQQAISGLAPILFGEVTLMCIYTYGIHNREEVDIWTALFIFLMMQISYHMSMSIQDLRIASKGLWAVYIVLSLLFVFIKLNYVVYKEFLIVILCIMILNMLLAQMLKIIFSVFK